jgi:ligand-binding sensor domain-containing protein/signal transduction histidine kinase
MRRIAPAVAFLVLHLAASAALAQRLPVRTYSAAEGLAGDDVRAILQDARGFLWVGTTSGLSRFDGREFRTYGTADGLPHLAVNHLLQDEDGTLWVATAGGLARLTPGARSFAAVPLEQHRSGIRLLHRDRAGTLWVAAGPHLFALSPGGEEVSCVKVSAPTEPPPGGELEIVTIAEGPDGTLWIGTNWGLLERRPDGAMVPWPVKPTAHDDSVNHLAVDLEGKLWITHWGIAHRPGVNWALYVADPPATRTPGQPAGVVRVRAGDGSLHARLAPGAAAEPLDLTYTTAGGPFGDARVHGVYPARDGRLWIATEEGVVRIDADGVRRFGPANGLGAPFRVIAEDRDGTLWLGSRGGGLSRLDGDAFVTYTEREGLIGREVTAIREDRSGRLCVSGVAADGRRWFGALEGDDLTSFTPRGTERLQYWGWGWGQTLLQDREGEWWLPTGEGLFRYPATESCAGLGAVRPAIVYRQEHGLSSDNIFRLFEDSHGDVWISAFGNPGLHRWVRATGRIQAFTEVGRLAPTAFAEDRWGGVWIGLYTGGLLRYRDGTLQRFAEADGVPAGFTETLFHDSAGRLWVAANPGGLARVDDPSAAQPAFTRPTRAEGLAESAVLSIVEDRFGRFYAATGRGVIQFDADMKRMRHLSTAEGLGSNLVRVSYADRHGALWFGTQQGLSRLKPRRDAPLDLPPIFIHGLRLAGVPHAVAQLGERDIGHLVLGPADGRVEIEYGVASLASGEILRYQARLEGADTDWLEPSTTRRMLYLNLAPGAYRFLVRAVHADGRVSPEPATVAFTVQSPLWRRAWFLALFGMALAGAVWILHRQRVHRLLALERVRTRLATDLHDDLGARLSRISILSEAARVRVGCDDAEAGRILEEVGATSRELIEASSDIAWSIDPAHDDLRSLATRVRRFASDMFDGRGVRWTFEAPADGALARLSPEIRRHVLLVFQEAINNIARHADPREVTLTLRVADHRLEAEIWDDGRGFPVAETDSHPADARAPTAAVSGCTGRGLQNMMARARELRGALQVGSKPGGGTRIRLVVPLR